MSVRESPPFLEAQGVDKAFSGVIALRGVSLEAYAGEVLCLLGDNGAGKSTLIKILSGIERPTRGQVLIEGRVMRLGEPGEARALGIATVHQNGGTVPLMSVARNFFLGAEPTKGRWPLRWLDARLCNQVALTELRAMGLTGVHNPHQLAGTLSGGERQALAIARALHFGARALILDEPTSALGVKEAAKVLRLIARARKNGVAVIFITHNATHALAVADRFVVLIHGEVAAKFAKGERTRAEVIELMAGGEELSELDPSLDEAQLTTDGR